VKMKIAFAVLIALSAADMAAAQTVVLGSSESRSCYEAVLGDLMGRDATIRECQKALLNPMNSRKDMASTHVNIGILHTRAEDYEASFSSFDKAIKIYPELADIYLNQAVSLFYTGEYQASVNSSTQALELGTEKRARTLLNRAMAYEGLNQHKMAYKDLKAAIEISPDWSLAREVISDYKIVSKTS